MHFLGKMEKHNLWILIDGIWCIHAIHNKIATAVGCRNQFKAFSNLSMRFILTISAKNQFFIDFAWDFLTDKSLNSICTLWLRLHVFCYDWKQTNLITDNATAQSFSFSENFRTLSRFPLSISLVCREIASRKKEKIV